MIFFIFPFFFSAGNKYFNVHTTIKENLPQKDLFGRSLAYCAKNQRLIVGAEWSKNNLGNTSKTGALYVFDYLREKNLWSQSQIIYPNDTSNVNVFCLGNTVKVSNDCRTIVSGAPCSNLIGENPVNESGAVVIFQHDGSSYKQVSVETPIEPIQGGGFGRTIDINSDAMFYAAANYNKFAQSDLNFEGPVEIHSNVYDHIKKALKWDKSVLDPPKELLNGTRYRFGNKIQFLDASTVIISTDDILDLSQTGIYIYKKSYNSTTETNSWQLKNKGINASDDGYNNIGEAFSMPLTNQDMIALTASNSTNSGIIFMKRNDYTDIWEKMYTIHLANGMKANQLYFCKESWLAASGTKSDGENIINTLFIFKNVNGKYQLYDTIYPPSQNNNTEDLHLNFLSSFEWDNDYCFRFYVGAMSKTGGSNGSQHIAYENGRVFVYQPNIISLRRSSADYDLLSTLSLTLVFALLLVILISVIIFYIVKLKNRWSQRSKSVQIE